MLVRGPRPAAPGSLGTPDPGGPLTTLDLHPAPEWVQWDGDGGNVAVADIDGDVRSISLVEPVLTTHSLDGNQRLVDVPFEVDPPNGPLANVPPDAVVLPAGTVHAGPARCRGRPLGLPLDPDRVTTLAISVSHLRDALSRGRGRLRRPRLPPGRAGPSAMGPARPHLLPFVGWVLAAMLPPWATGAHAENALERALERLQPCRSLKVQTALGAVGIDQFKAISVPRIGIAVDGDRAAATMGGSIACRTSDHAVVRGDASATFDVSFTLDLRTCTLGDQKVDVTSTGGTFGGLVQAMRGRISSTLQDGLASELKKLCQ